jgi:hypothetical protein
MAHHMARSWPAVSDTVVTDTHVEGLGTVDESLHHIGLAPTGQEKESLLIVHTQV